MKNFEIAFPPLSPLTAALMANAPTPSPFQASGTVIEHQGPRDVAVTPFLINFWHDSTSATLKFAVTVEGLELAPARVTITTPGTELAAMFGNDTATSDDGTSNHARFRRATVVRTLIDR